jgi:DNA-binding transcriptional regulator YiaG
MADKKQKDFSENTTSPETLKPLPKNRQEEFSHSRPLTPQELKELREDTELSTKVMRGRFKDLIPKKN